MRGVPVTVHQRNRHRAVSFRKSRGQSLLRLRYITGLQHLAFGRYTLFYFGHLAIKKLW